MTSRLSEVLWGPLPDRCERCISEKLVEIEVPQRGGSYYICEACGFASEPFEDDPDGLLLLDGG